MLQESFFKNKRVTVFGLGQNSGGVGTVKFLAGQGVREIIVTDIKTREELSWSLQKLEKYKNITYVLGQHRTEDFTHVDMVIKNPVIPWTNEYVKLSEKHGVPVAMDSGIFMALCRATVIGVTGTKGKTTTATLIAHILEAAGQTVIRVGIGQEGVLGMLSSVTPESVVVFELSSWRLSALGRLKKSPSIAVLTNIYPDHLNYYKTLSAYIADKKNIFLFQKQKDFLIANFDDIEIRTMAQEAKGKLIWFSKDGDIDNDGAWVQDDRIYIRKLGVTQELMSLSGISLKGEHNVGNVIAAVAAALAAGISLKLIARGVASFPGIPHRMERIGEKRGVQYYNDTAATIPEAAIAALRSFQEPVILIAGGSDKRLDFVQMAKEILRHSKKAILFKGEATEKLLQALKSEAKMGELERSFDVVENMEKAVGLASGDAKPGDVVLLSPGATSFGIFQNEFDRGEQFRSAVENLP